MGSPHWRQLLIGLIIAGFVSLFVIFSPNQQSYAQTDGKQFYQLSNGRADIITEFSDGALTNVYFQANGRRMANAAPDGAFNFTLQNAQNNAKITVSANQFRFSLVELRNNNPTTEVQRMIFDGTGEWAGGPLKLRLFYELKPNENFVETWFELDPIATPDWMVRYAAPQRWQFSRDYVVPPMIRDWYFLTRQRVPRGTTPTLMLTSGNGSGLYFFTNTAVAREYLNPANNVMNLEQSEWHDVTQGFRSAGAVTGGFLGGENDGSRNFTSYLSKYYSLLNKEQKKTPFYYSVWKLYTSDINEQIVLNTLDVVGQAGLHEMLHIDAGWEGGYPVEISKSKFPSGFDRINAKAQSYNLSLSLWINPYSNSYFGYTNYAPFHRDYRGWHVPERESLAEEDGKLYYKGPFAVNSPYSDFVEERLVGLITKYDIRQIYWDGSDWNIPESEIKNLPDEEADRRRVVGVKRLERMMNRLHQIRPDLLIVGWNSWADPHLLHVLDQQQLSDIYQAPLGIAEVARRQLYYSVSYYLPFNTIWSDWYGLTYKERRDTANLNLPLDRLKFAELSMVHKGVKEAGAAFDLRVARPELLDFLRKLFAFRRHFDQYWENYQHLLQRPDPNRVDASAHLLNGQGFLLLNNPTNSPQYIGINFNPFAVGLKTGHTYSLYDWSDVTSGRFIGQLPIPANGATVGWGMSVPPNTTKIIGLDISEPVGGGRPAPAFESVDRAFYNVWQKGDIANAQGKAKRDWIWGQKIEGKSEPSNFSKSGERIVEYYDKGKLEIADPTADRASPFFVSSALLVKELVSGNYTIDTGEYRYKNPPFTGFAGDGTLTYAAMRKISTIDEGEKVAPDRTGQPITSAVDRDGNVSDKGNMMPEVVNARFVRTTGHNIANVFWDYFKYIPYDWQFLTGLPISEPYYTEVNINGRMTPALVQIFERRILTYVPSNEPSYRVQHANVGIHHYLWRFGSLPNKSGGNNQIAPNSFDTP
jgi:Melibiase